MIQLTTGTKVLVVSDLHVGSDVGLCPDVVRINKGNRKTERSYTGTAVQQIMYDKWCKMCDLIKPDLVILNGDICEGVNYKGNGVGNWTNDRNQQIQTAAELIEMIDCDTFIGLQGSGYHTGNNMSMDECVTRWLKGDFGIDKFINVDGVRIHARHSTSFSRRPQRQAANMIDDMTNVDYDRDTFPNVDIFVRSHLHRFSFVGWNGALGVITPAWKWRDAFVKERNIISNDLGFVLFDIKDGQYTWNPYIFKIPMELAVDEYTYNKKSSKFSF